MSLSTRAKSGRPAVRPSRSRTRTTRLPRKSDKRAGGAQQHRAREPRRRVTEDLDRLKYAVAQIEMTRDPESNARRLREAFLSVCDDPAEHPAFLPSRRSRNCQSDGRHRHRRRLLARSRRAAAPAAGSRAPAVAADLVAEAGSATAPRNRRESLAAQGLDPRGGARPPGRFASLAAAPRRATLGGAEPAPFVSGRCRGFPDIWLPSKGTAVVG